MTTHAGLESYLNWLLNHSLEAGVLVLLVLLVQWVFRRQFTSRWRFALWWIVLARLLLPFSPESAVSLFNVFQPKIGLEGLRYSVAVQPSAPARIESAPIAPSAVPRTQNAVRQVEGGPATVPGTVGRESSDQDQRAPSVSVPVLNGTAIAPHSLRLEGLLIPGLAGLWLVGVLVLIGVVATQLIRFNRKLAMASSPADHHLQKLFDECQQEFGLSGRIELLEAEAVQSPALFGLLRLRLLLPRGIGGQFDGRGLRYIFLHELAHVKRGDLWLNWLVTALQIVHWFNPLLWLGFARLRADRELACDELALLRAGDEAGNAYGETVVKLLENLNRPAAIPGLVGILEDKQQMRRRISMIAGFRRPGRRSALAVFLVGALAVAALTDAQPNKPDTEASNTASAAGSSSLDARPDITGQVLGKSGVPLPAPATVFIATAAPKSGTSSLCPSCYADCTKHARTDASGGFKIESLDPKLTFKLLAVAKGYRPEYVVKVDPTRGAPVRIELEPIESADAAPGRSLRGRVVNAKGVAIEGAVVEMQGTETKDGGGSWGALSGVDPLAVTDEKGEFLITSKNAFEMMTVKVTAQACADKNFTRLASGTTRHELVMTEGAALTGRLLLDGKPLAGVLVGVSAVDRTAGSYLGHFEAGTGARGDFMFVNLPPDADFHLYSLMETMQSGGAVVPQRIHTGKDGTTVDAGNLAVGPAHRLAGRVVLSDGEALPTQTRLLVGRDEAWDSMQVTLDKDGRFDVGGIPPELLSLSVRCKGYHVSGQNVSVDQLNPFHLLGRVDRDITNLVFMLERGAAPQPDFDQVPPDYEELRSRPLQGAEAAQDHSKEWMVSGRVFDTETKKPIRNFRITFGQAAGFGQTSWDTLRASNGTNGAYLAYVSKRVVEPLLKVEAEGYLPESKVVRTRDSTNVDFALKPGSGPTGTVVLANGKPALGATVVLLGEGHNQAGLTAAGELTTRQNSAASRTVDTHGHFAFKPAWGMNAIAAASSNGFGIMSLESFATNQKIVLEPFGTISGTLTRAASPGTNEQLILMFAGTDNAGRGRINLSNRASTDEQGRFAFERVPAGPLRIFGTDPVQTGLGSMYIPLQDVELKPGEKLDLSIAAADRKATEETRPYQRPQPKRIAGVELKGVVLSPAGKPAADAEVALAVEGKYLRLGKGTFTSRGNAEEGLLVRSGQDGGFTLPMYEGAQSVVALNEEGFARVSLEQLKASPRITLEKWGRIEGTLRVGRHLGTNEQVTVYPAMPSGPRMRGRKTSEQTNEVEITDSSPAMVRALAYDSKAFQARTDEQGRFVITFVPPAPHVIGRLVPTGDNSWRTSQLATVDVTAGETTVTNVGGTGRTVIGKVKTAEGTAPSFRNRSGYITTQSLKLLERGWQLKTDAERKAFFQSPEVQAAFRDRWAFSVLVSQDGSFRAEDVMPGKYEFQGVLADPKSSKREQFISVLDLVVPEATVKGDDSAVDWGEVELRKVTLPIPEGTSVAK